MNDRSNKTRKPGMNRRAFLKTTLAAGGATCLSGVAWPNTGTRRLNVVFYLVDDMGWIDSTVYGSRYYETPNLERLARISTRFTNAYSAAPLCTATRASIMTGNYPGRLHITGAGGHVKDPENPGVPEKGPPHREILGPLGKGALPLEQYTLAEALRDQGYETCFVGKWHLGHDEKYWPEHQGFDTNIGGGRWPGPPSYFSPYHISKLPDGPEGEYIADRLTDEAIQFIDSVQGKPFFLNFWQYAVHAPYQSKQHYRAHFEEKQDPRGAQDNAVMAAMIKSMDESLGRVLDKLEEKGLMNDTVIVFTSDNGGNMYDRTARDGTNLGPWAPAGRTPTNNAPLRSGKGSVYEGGVRVPAMIYWPGVADNERVSDEVISSIDYYPTLLDMLDIPKRDDKIFDGISIVPALRGRPLQREAIFCHFPHHAPAVPIQMASWVRKGDWKLIRFYQQDEHFPNRIELYDLDHDIGEMRNQAKAMPDLAKELENMLDEHLRDIGAAVPKRNPDYDPDALQEAKGWKPFATCFLTMEGGALQIHSTGGDPHIATSAVPGIDGDLRLELELRSNSSGMGQFFWATAAAPRFGPQQRLDFRPSYDGGWEKLSIPFEAKSELRALRIDPSTGTGVTELRWIRLLRENGALAAEWNFGV